MTRRVARERHLEEPADLLEMGDTLRLNEKEPGDRGEVVEHHRGVRGAHPRLHPTSDLDDAALAQRKEGLADGRTADAETAHELAFGGKVVADLVDTASDLRFEALDDLVGDARPADRRFFQIIIRRVVQVCGQGEPPDENSCKVPHRPRRQQQGALHRSCQ